MMSVLQGMGQGPNTLLRAGFQRADRTSDHCHCHSKRMFAECGGRPPLLISIVDYAQDGILNFVAEVPFLHSLKSRFYPSGYVL